MSTKDVYGAMAPMTYTRGLGASPSKPRQSPPPAIAGRPHAPSLRGQVGRLKRRKRRDGVKTLGVARERVSGLSALDDDGMAIYRVASGLDQPARDLTGIKTAMARIEVKAPQPSDDTERCLRCHEDIVGWYEVEDGAKHGFPGYDAVVCLPCSGTAETKRGDHDSSTHADIPNGPGRNWVEDRGGLPDYIHRVARHIHADSGYGWSHAIAAAINVMKRRAAKGNAAAAASLTRWEAMKTSKSLDLLVEAKTRL